MNKTALESFIEKIRNNIQQKNKEYISILQNFDIEKNSETHVAIIMCDEIKKLSNRDKVIYYADPEFFLLRYQELTKSHDVYIIETYSSAQNYDSILNMHGPTISFLAIGCDEAYEVGVCYIAELMRFFSKGEGLTF